MALFWRYKESSSASTYPLVSDPSPPAAELTQTALLASIPICPIHALSCRIPLARLRLIPAATWFIPLRARLADFKPSSPDVAKSAESYKPRPGRPLPPRDPSKAILSPGHHPLTSEITSQRPPNEVLPASTHPPPNSPLPKPQSLIANLDIAPPTPSHSPRHLRQTTPWTRSPTR